MGTFGMFSAGSTWTGDPNPKNFKVEKFLAAVGDYVVIKVHYPDALSFHGRTVLVYKDISYEDLCNAEVLDPHFSETGLSPVARFRPTEEGIREAISFCHYRARHGDWLA